MRFIVTDTHPQCYSLTCWLNNTFFQWTYSNLLMNGHMRRGINFNARLFPCLQFVHLYAVHVIQKWEWRIQSAIWGSVARDIYRCIVPTSIFFLLCSGFGNIGELIILFVSSFTQKGTRADRISHAGMVQVLLVWTLLKTLRYIARNTFKSMFMYRILSSYPEGKKHWMDPNRYQKFP